MVDLLLVQVRLCIALADALGNYAGVALGVASILAIFALHAGAVLEEFRAEGTPHDVVKLVLDKLVPVHFVHSLFLLPDGALTIEPQIDWPAVLVLLHEAERKLHLTRRPRR